MQRRAVIAIALAAFLSGCATTTSDPVALELDFEGLQQIKSRHFDVAKIRPGVNFDAYTGLMVDEPELAFRTPDRSQHEFALSDEQKGKFLNMLASQFQSQLAQSQRLTLVEAAGPGVLSLSIRVQDVNATIPPNSGGRVGRAGVFLTAAGEATLVLEVRDSQSNEVLARAAEVRAVEGAAMLQKGGGAVTSWTDVDKLCEQWAITARERLDVLIDNP